MQREPTYVYAARQREQGRTSVDGVTTAVAYRLLGFEFRSLMFSVDLHHSSQHHALARAFQPMLEMRGFLVCDRLSLCII